MRECDVGDGWQRLPGEGLGAGAEREDVGQEEKRGSDHGSARCWYLLVVAKAAGVQAMMRVIRVPYRRSSFVVLCCEPRGVVRRRRGRTARGGACSSRFSASRRRLRAMGGQPGPPPAPRPPFGQPSSTTKAA